ncbi:MAG: DUF456 domain-containing protein [Anaerolineales bacterium]
MIPNWLNLPLQILTYLIMLVGLLGMIIPIYPGVIIIWAAALAHGLATGFSTLEIWVILLLTLLAIAGSLVDNLLMGGKARQAGATWTSIGLALSAGLVGTFLLPPLGGLITAPLTLFLAEYLRVHDHRRSWRITLNLLTGWGLSFFARFGIGLTMIIIWALWGIR